ncbi:putative alpha/beta hydrolase [Mycobacterium interjectum]
MSHLQYLNVGDLIAGAGGDPWAVNQSLQVT